MWRLKWLPLVAPLAPLVAQEVQDVDGLSQEMQYLWDLVVVQQQSRNVPQGDSPPLRRACQFGLSEGSAELAEWMLTFPDPPLEVGRICCGLLNWEFLGNFGGCAVGWGGHGSQPGWCHLLVIWSQCFEPRSLYFFVKIYGGCLKIVVTHHSSHQCGHNLGVPVYRILPKNIRLLVTTILFYPHISILYTSIYW